MSLRVRRAGVMAVAFVAGASILHVSSSAALALSTGGTERGHLAAPTAPAPRPTPEAIFGDAAGAGAPAVGSTSADAVASLTATRLRFASAGPFWAIRLPASGAGAASRLTMRSRLDEAMPTGQTMAVSVRIGAGPRETVLTNAVTVRQLLRAMKVHLGADDLIRPAPRTALSATRKVRLVKVRRVSESVTVAIPFPTVVHYTNDLSVGQTVVNRSGSSGLARQRVVSTYLNGRLISRKIVATQVITAPVEQIVFKGKSQTEGGARIGIASWYACSGFHAASPWLPFGTVVRVTNLANGRTVSVVINDRGPYGPGRIIDLCSPAFSVIAPLDQGLAKVRITW
jgi:hypothetical protein